uniref:S-methyl-5-thioribose-1-phosphate isomerase n=1 Tax=candidate division CPR3 bacterium TaxID=2268181 RepID=A0A7C4R2M8_UNCC3
MDKIDSLEKDIISLKIQGATNIAFSVLEGIVIASKKIPANKPVGEYLEKIGKKLAYARPTEPLAQNAIRFIFSNKKKGLEYYLLKVAEYKKLISEAKIKMGEEGIKLIHDGGVYFTHCHSSTVTSIFIKAYKQGKKFSVIATETRPRFQGRITVRELLDAGIEDVTLIIDDAIETILQNYRQKIKAVFLGADLLSCDGFVNKIGSLGIAYSAYHNNIPFYSMSILLKYDPRSFSNEMIEKRSEKEIWKDAPAKLKIYSPAFDFVPYDTGVKIVSEAGIIEGKEVSSVACSSYSFLK